MRVLVTGGVRSGKSAHAEALLNGPPDVTYVAPGRPAEGADPDWAARVARHRSRRPTHWATIETSDLATAIRGAGGPVLVDCLGTWVTAIMDDRQLWDAGTDAVDRVIDAELDAVCEALGQLPSAVVVTNEVGLGVVPPYRSGALFRDVLGTVNQRVATVCDEVHLVIAGRVLKL